MTDQTGGNATPQRDSFKRTLGLTSLVAVAIGLVVGQGPIVSAMQGFALGGSDFLIAIVIGAISVFGLLAGFALLNHQQWARYLMLFVSALRLFRWPWGTLFGGYSIWVLTHDDTRRLFAMRA
jgi:hypothetical protein